MAILIKSTAHNRAFLMVQSSDHITGLTGATVTVTLSKNGAAFGAAGGAITEIASGWYSVALNTTDTGTAGDLAIHCTATSGDPTDFCDQVVDTTVATIGANVVSFGGTTVTGRDIGASVLLSAGSGSGQLDFTSGVVKSNLTQILGTALTETAGQIAAAFKQWFNVATPVGTVNSIPNATAGASGGLLIAGSNAATTVAITGNITGNLSGSVGSVTGAVGSVTGGVTVTTNNDKTGYTASTVSDKTGYALTAAYDAAKTAAQAGNAMALTSGERNSTADAILDRDMSTGTDSGTTTVRTVRQALRFLRNKWAISAGTLTVYKEDDTASSWTSALTTTAGANPVTTSDPAG